MRCDFEARDLFNVVSAGCVSRRHGLVFTANPLQAWPVRDGAQPPRLSAPPAPVHCLRLSVDERSLAVATADIIKIIDVQHGRETRTLVGHVQPVLAICGHNTNVYNWVSGSTDACCIAWDVRRHPADILRLRASGPVRAVAMSPDDSVLAVGTDFSLQLFDLRQRALLKQINNVSVHGLSFHPSEYLLSSFGADRVVRFWDLDTFECVSVSEPAENDIKSASFVPSGDLLMACTDARLRLLAWEPCNVLGEAQLPNCSKVVNVFPSDDSVDILCAFADRSVSLYSTTYEETLSAGDHEVVSPSDSLPDSPVRLSPSQNSDGAENSETPDSEGSLTEETERESALIVPTAELVDLEVTQEAHIDKERAPRVGLRRSTAASTSSLSSLSTSRAVTPSGRPPMGSRPSSTRKEALVVARQQMNETRARHGSTGSLAEVRRKPPLPTTLERKREERRASVTRRVEKETKAEGDAKTEDDVLSFIVSGHATVALDLEDKQKGLNRLRDTWKRRGTEEAVQTAGSDRFLTSQLMHQLSQNNKWTIALAAQLLPRMRVLLTDRSFSVRTSSLASLTKVVTQLGDAIRSNARSAPSLGVDVAAEQRHENASKCLKDLLDLHVNSAFVKDKMSAVEAQEFDALMTLVDA